MMTNVIKQIILGCVLLVALPVWSQTPKFETTESIYSFSEVLSEDNIEWGYLTVPENWNDPRSINI
ncbi:MAG: hypothetical protein AAF466_01780, partial [Bacteroidota bacterium]